MSETTLLDEMLDPFALCLDAENARRIAEFRISPLVQDQVDTLASRANEGTLTPQEREEYEALLNAADFIALLKLKARREVCPNLSR